MAGAPTVSHFVMHGAREAMEGGMLHIEEQVKGIESAVDENPGLAFDLAKTLIESACRTILTERQVSFDRNEDLPRLFRTVSNQLPFLPATASSEAAARESLTRTLSGLSTALQGVAELRNACGFASHGTDSPRPVMEGAQALLAAQAADTIVGFLHRVHRQRQTNSSNARMEYSHNGDFNEYVDEAHESVHVFEVPIRPSEALYHVDIEAYRNYLAEYEAASDEDDDPRDSGATP